MALGLLRFVTAASLSFADDLNSTDFVSWFVDRVKNYFELSVLATVNDGWSFVVVALAGFRSET